MGEKKKVLVVEDDQIVRSSLVRLLRDAGLDIQSAGTGEEGLEKYSHTQHDLVLTDVKLPGIDGLDMVRRMRDADNALPFIVFSAYGEGEDVLRAMELGAVNYYQKPFDAVQLLELTKRCVQGRIGTDNGVGQLPNTLEAVMEDMKSTNSNQPLPDNSSELFRILRLLAPFVSLGKQGTGITHNLNGPLTGMMGHLELMKIKHPEMGNDVDIIMGLAKKLRDNIADLQIKFENETMQDPQLISINHVLRSELAYLQSDLFFKHYIEREIEFDKTIPNVKGIFSDFSLAFEEIIINAIDVQRGNKEGRISIRTSMEGADIRIDFIDAGPGFSEEALQKAFDPCWPDVRIWEDGNVRIGMGLYACRHWLDKYGARIEIENLQPRGARVTVFIPKKVE